VTWGVLGGIHALVKEQSSELKELLHQIFQDEIVEPRERTALAAFTEQLGHEESTTVFRQFLKEKWGEVIADDIITNSEMRLLGHIMTELHLEASDLPEQARLALRDAF
jgi:hypothetical protein